MALPWGRPFALLALATPPALDVRRIGKMRRIDNKDFYRPWRVADAAACANCCHPGFLFSAVGALRGTGLAKRL